MQRPGVLFFLFILIPQILSDTNITNFHEITLKRKDIKMLVLGQCEEVQKHEHDQNFNANFLSHPKNGTSGKYELILYIRNKYVFQIEVTRQKIAHDCEEEKEYSEQSSYVTKLGTLVTLFCFSMRMTLWTIINYQLMNHDIITFWNCISSPFLIVYTKTWRPHSWESSAPYWTGQRKRVRDKNRLNYRKHVAADNKTLIEHLDNFTFVSSWILPPFKVHHVREHKDNDCFSCKIFLGRQLRVSDKAWPRAKQDLPLYWGSQTPSSDQRWEVSDIIMIVIMSSWSGAKSLVTPEYVPVTLPCLPAHPLVKLELYKWAEVPLSCILSFS